MSRISHTNIKSWNMWEYSNYLFCTQLSWPNSLLMQEYGCPFPPSIKSVGLKRHCKHTKSRLPVYHRTVRTVEFHPTTATLGGTKNKLGFKWYEMLSASLLPTCPCWTHCPSITDATQWTLSLQRFVVPTFPSDMVLLCVTLVLTGDWVFSQV